MSKSETTDRSPKDFAIEFGRYLATAAENYMAAVADYAIKADSGPVDYETDQIVSERCGALQSAIHEFRKRALRAEHGVG